MHTICAETQLISALKPRTVKAFQSGRVEAQYPQGCVLLDQNHIAEGIYVVLSGRIRVSSLTNGTAGSVRIARRGEVLGLSTAVCGKSSETTAETVSRARLAYMPTTYLMKLMQRDAEFAYRVVCALCQSLRDPYDRFRPPRRRRRRRNSPKRS